MIEVEYRDLPTDLTGLQIAEAIVGLFLVVVAAIVITRPAHRSNRVLVGVAVTAFALGLVGIVDGLNW